ncbi:MAG: diacylglycerol kinase family protein [Deltaproteobacteria bacterium]|nr:diacylglycerol kinase family protein [Deltaproteobacteria bacterium]
MSSTPTKLPMVQKVPAERDLPLGSAQNPSDDDVERHSSSIENEATLISSAQKPSLENYSFLQSFGAALNGIGRIVASQRNMKIHVLSALMVCVVGMALPLDLSSRVALLIAIAVVFFAEILNTGLEALVDLFIGAYHRLAMLAKDAAAAGVLVFALATVLIFSDILWTNWELVTNDLDSVWRSVAYGVPVVLLEAAGLFLTRRGKLAGPRFVLSFALLMPLMLTSRDPIFAGLAGALLVLSAWGRYTFPKTMGRGAPAHLLEGDTTRMPS